MHYDVPKGRVTLSGRKGQIIVIWPGNEGWNNAEFRVNGDTARPDAYLNKVNSGIYKWVGLGRVRQDYTRRSRRKRCARQNPERISVVLGRQNHNGTNSPNG